MFASDVCFHKHRLYLLGNDSISVFSVKSFSLLQTVPLNPASSSKQLKIINKSAYFIERNTNTSIFARLFDVNEFDDLPLQVRSVSNNPCEYDHVSFVTN